MLNSNETQELLNEEFAEAISYRDFERAKELIEKGANVNTPSEAVGVNREIFQEPPLAILCDANLEFVKYLISKGADPHIPYKVKRIEDEDFVPTSNLLQRVGDEFKATLFLLFNGFDRNLINSNGQTPLLESIQYMCCYNKAKALLLYKLLIHDDNLLDLEKEYINKAAIYNYVEYAKVLKEIIETYEKIKEIISPWPYELRKELVLNFDKVQNQIKAHPNQEKKILETFRRYKLFGEVCYLSTAIPQFSVENEEDKKIILPKELTSKIMSYRANFEISENDVEKFLYHKTRY
ncbi:MAG: hypothetical protein J0H68_00525 [Sphingobacteriia bacterium]|nr:hypothetical protein [Sphingobacteriia bacterium]